MCLNLIIKKLTDNMALIISDSFNNLQFKVKPLNLILNYPINNGGYIYGAAYTNAVIMSSHYNVLQYPLLKHSSIYMVSGISK